MKLLTALVVFNFLLLSIYVQEKEEKFNPFTPIAYSNQYRPNIFKRYVETKRGEALASWYGFESCTNERCLQANTKPMVEGDDGIACSSSFRLGDRLSISYGSTSLILTCTDRGNLERLGRDFDIHKWSFAKLAPLTRGVIEVRYEILQEV